MSVISLSLEVSELKKKNELNKLKNQRERLRAEKAHKETLIKAIDLKIDELGGECGQTNKIN